MSEQQQVIIRPVTEADLGHFDTGATPETDAWNFFGWRPPGRLRREFAENGLLTPEFGQLVVEAGGQVVGDVSWHQEVYGPPPAAGYALNIGISLHPQHRGHGFGSRAQRLLADYLLATYPVNRIEAGTDAENIAEQRALEKAGFTREGVTRGCQFRSGSWHDLVMFSRLRGD